MKNHFLHYQILLKYDFSPAQPARLFCIAKPTQASQIIALCLSILLTRKIRLGEKLN